MAAGGPAPAAVASHLATCAGCREELAALRRGLALAEAELAGLLSAEPSPELAVRIRQAVAEPSPGGRLGWLWPATAAAVLLLVAFAVWSGRGPWPEARVANAPVMAGAEPGGSRVEPSHDIPEIPGRPRPPDHLEAPEPHEGPRVWPVSGHPPSPRPPRRPSRSDALPEPEVLVPPGGEEALLRFVALVHRERLSPSALVATGRPSADLEEPKPLDIPPLEIVPLDPAETSGT